MNKLDSMLGLAAKAGKLLVGTASVEQGIKKHEVYLVICATDLSVKTIKNFRYLCDSHQTELFCYGLRSGLGKIIGMPERGIIGITSKQFASTLRQLLEDRGDES